MIALTSRMQDHLRALFDARDLEAAADLLERECADNLDWRNPTPHNLERVRFAAIRMSGGNLEDLRDAVALAKLDWRDLLVGADFANDPTAHLRWQPARLDPATLQRWFSGERPGKSTFGVGDSVEIVSGRYAGELGAVISPLRLEPTPKYLVELGSGRELESWQHALKRAD